MAAGKVLLIIGGVLTVIALIMILVGIFALSSSTDLTNPEDKKVAEGTGTFTADLKAGEVYQVWCKDSMADAEITGPNNASVTEDIWTFGSSRNGYYLLSQFTSGVSGQYTIEVTSGFPAAPSTSKTVVSNEIDTEEEVGEAVGGAMAFIFGWCGGLALGIPGVILLIIGLILTLVNKGKSKEQPPQAAPPQDYQPPM